MKHLFLSLLACLLIASLAACGGTETTDQASSEPSAVTESAESPAEQADYPDAESFESAVNNGEKVTGKTVRFVVLEYAPNSKVGVNCQAGEHLNFISANALDVSAGYIVTGKVTEEPTNLLGSWLIPYEVLSIEEGEPEPAQTEEPEQAQTEEPEQADSGNLGDYTVSIKDCVQSTDYEGKPALIVNFDFTNNSEEAQSFIVAVNTIAFQDGVQLDSAFMMSDDYDIDAQMKKIQPGVTLPVQLAYSLTSENPVTVEVTELFSFDDDTKLVKEFSLS